MQNIKALVFLKMYNEASEPTKACSCQLRKKKNIYLAI